MYHCTQLNSTARHSDCTRLFLYTVHCESILLAASRWSYYYGQMKAAPSHWLSNKVTICLVGGANPAHSPNKTTSSEKATPTQKNGTHDPGHCCFNNEWAFDVLFLSGIWAHTQKLDTFQVRLLPKPQLVWCVTSFESCGYHPLAVELLLPKRIFQASFIDLAASSMWLWVWVCGCGLSSYLMLLEVLREFIRHVFTSSVGSSALIFIPVLFSAAALNSLNFSKVSICVS